MARAALPGTPLAPGAARMVRETLADWGELALPGAEIVRERLAEDAVLVVSELVTNAVVHAGTDVELLCRLEITDGGAVGAVVRWSSPTAIPGGRSTRGVGRTGFRHTGVRAGAAVGRLPVGGVGGSRIGPGSRPICGRGCPWTGGWVSRRGWALRVGWVSRVSWVLKVG